MLGSVRGSLWGVLGAHVSLPGRPGEVLGVHVWPTGALREALGDACARLEGPRRALDIAFGDPKGENVAVVAKRSIFVFFKGGLQGRCTYFQKRWFSRPGGPWGLPGRRVVAPCGSLGAPGTMGQLFFGARGVPLERPRYVPLQIKTIKPSVF